MVRFQTLSELRMNVATEGRQPSASSSWIAGVLAIILTGGAIVALLLNWFDPSPASYGLAFWTGVACAAGCGLLFARSTWPGILREQRSPTLLTSILTGVLGSITCGALVLVLGMRHFGGFDHSVLVDVSWRMLSGQHLYSDFPCTLPVGFSLGGYYAFQIFGPYWKAFVYWQALFSAVTFVWSFWLLYRLSKSVWEAGLLALTIQYTTNIVTSYWWYNSATTTLASLLFLSAADFWRDPSSRYGRLSYTVALALLASMKPNVAGPLIIGTSAVFFASRAHRRLAFAFSLAALCAFVAWLWAHNLQLTDVLRSYMSISGRGLSLNQFLQDMAPADKGIALALFGLLSVPFCRFLFSRWRTLTGEWLAVPAFLAGAYGFVVNGENKLVDLPLLLLALWWIQMVGHRLVKPVLTPPRRSEPLLWSNLTDGITIALLVLGLATGGIRQRVKSIGMNTFYEDRTAKVETATAFSSELQTGLRFVLVEAEIARALSDLAPRKVFFGPRMQWAYAAFAQSPPRGEPIWWHPGVSYAQSDEAKWLSDWNDNQHDVLIFLARDYTYLPSGLLKIVSQSYVPVRGYWGLDVFTRAASNEATSKSRSTAQ